MHSFNTSGKIGRYLPTLLVKNWQYLLGSTVFCCFVLLNWPHKTYDGSDFLDVPFVPASTLSTPSTSTSIFDDVHMFAHGAATDHASRSGMPWERKRFDRDSLLNWKRGDGGLQDSDRVLLAKYYNVANSAFEFGLGESSKIAAYTNMPNFKGVDSDPVWVGIARDMAPSHFRFEFLDIGATIAWGHAVDQSLKKIPLNYMTQPLSSEPYPFDFYLVDGRYRIACALTSFLHALSRGASRDHIRVAIHDYISRPGSYDDIEIWADRVEFAERLCVFKLKDGVTEAMLVEAWKKYMFDDK